jgi:hypothetical protein
MRIGLKLENEPFMVIEIPDDTEFVGGNVGAPNVRMPGKDLRRIENLRSLTATAFLANWGP